MNRMLAMLCIGLIFGGGIGFTFAAANGITLDGHDHGAASDHASHNMAAQGVHNHDEIVNLPGEGPAPSLTIDVTTDPSTGWNLHIMTTDFRFAPEHASTDHVAGEGHAHVYVNGSKVARNYGPWFHLADLPRGENTIEVTLNANDHRLLASNGEPLRAVTKVVVE